MTKIYKVYKFFFASYQLYTIFLQFNNQQILPLSKNNLIIYNNLKHLKNVYCCRKKGETDFFLQLENN